MPGKPFQETVILALNSNVVVGNIQVPSGADLVIEYASASTEIPAGQRLLHVWLQTTASGAQKQHSLVLFPQGNFQQAGLDHFASGQVVRLYADAGSIVEVIAVTTAAAPGRHVDVTISGRLQT
jgi:hypothetical protein